MSHIILVRHGQASLLEQDYDRLCANGEAQAKLLGEYWSRRNIAFSRVYSGPRVRQRETARLVGEAYRGAGLVLEETVIMEEFDEYQADAVLRGCLAKLLPVNIEIRELHAAFQDSSTSDDRRKTFQKLFEAVISKWVAGEVVADGIESWPEFCLRVERGLAQVVRDSSGSDRSHLHIGGTDWRGYAPGPASLCLGHVARDLDVAQCVVQRIPCVG
jgi:broad specificity phosphatase PhoE